MTQGRMIRQLEQCAPLVTLCHRSPSVQSQSWLNQYKNYIFISKHNHCCHHCCDKCALLMTWTHIYKLLHICRSLPVQSQFWSNQCKFHHHHHHDSLQNVQPIVFFCFCLILNGVAKISSVVELTAYLQKILSSDELK